MSNRSDDDKSQPKTYEVGYRKPPVQTRFVKGQSGNPLGRPKKSKSPSTGLDKTIRDLILKEGRKLIPVRDGGIQSEMSAIAAIIKAEILAALKGNPVAQRNAIARHESAARDLAAEIEEGHAFWQGYCDKYRELGHLGKPLPDEYPHPDDLIFEEGKRVTFAWTPKLAAEKKKIVDTLLLQAEKDMRILRVRTDSSEEPKPSSLILAYLMNQCLPERYRINDMQLTIIMMRYETLTKRNLERALKESWQSLDAPYRKDKVLPPIEPHIKPLRKLFSSITRLT